MTKDILCVSCEKPFPVFVFPGRPDPERYVCPYCRPDWWSKLDMAQPWFWTQVAQFVAFSRRD